MKPLGLVVRLASLVAILLVSSPPGAEVAVSIGDGNQQLVHGYVLTGIVDDPDPSGIWIRYNADGPTRAVLNDQGVVNGDGPPSMIRDAAGRPIVVWSKNSPTGFDVVFSTFTEGAWTAPELLAASSADELDPFVVLDPTDGTVHVFYWVHDETPRVMHRQAVADLSSWSTAQQLSAPGEIASRPAAVYHAGNLHVVYENHFNGYGTTPREIVIAVDQGAGFSADVVTLTSYSEANWPQVHSKQGMLWVEWLEASDEMDWTRQPTGGVWESIQIELFDSQEELDYFVRGAIKFRAVDD